jgi:hypothetical protein
MDEIEMYVNDDTGCYIESLCKCRKHLEGSALLAKLDAVLELELDLATVAAEKSSLHLS